MSVADTKPKLPKLYLPKFKGDIVKFTAFLDSFKSSVDDNRDISVVDKFNYLYSLLEGEALHDSESKQMRTLFQEKIENQLVIESLQITLQVQQQLCNQTKYIHWK